MKKILYVEDNEMNRDMLGRRLSRRDFEVIFALDGQEGLDKLTDVTWKDWDTNYKGFIQYGVRDVEILKEINDKINIFGLYTTIQSIANLDSLGLVFYKSMIVDKNWFTNIY